MRQERAIFTRAVERGNLLVAETTARQMGRVSLVESLELTCLSRLKDPRRRSRVAASWLLRYLEAHELATIEEAATVASALAALGGQGHEAAHDALVGMAELATRRPVSHGAAKESRRVRFLRAGLPRGAGRAGPSQLR